MHASTEMVCATAHGEKICIILKCTRSAIHCCWWFDCSVTAMVTLSIRHRQNTEKGSQKAQIILVWFLFFPARAKTALLCRWIYIQYFFWGSPHSTLHSVISWTSCNSLHSISHPSTTLQVPATLLDQKFISTLKAICRILCGWVGHQTETAVRITLLENES